MQAFFVFLCCVLPFVFIAPCLFKPFHCLTLHTHIESSIFALLFMHAIMLCMSLFHLYSLPWSLHPDRWAVCVQHGLSEPASVCRATTRAGTSVWRSLSSLRGHWFRTVNSVFLFFFPVGGHDAQDSPAVPTDFGPRVLGGCNESGPQLHHFLVDILPPGWWWQSGHFPGVLWQKCVMINRVLRVQAQQLILFGMDNIANCCVIVFFLTDGTASQDFLPVWTGKSPWRGVTEEL